LSSKKPFWGHSLPLTLKEIFSNEYELPTKTISLSNLEQNLNTKEAYIVKDLFFCEENLLPTKLHDCEDLYLYFTKEIVIRFKKGEFIECSDSNKKIINFINTVLVSGSRVKEIQSRVKSFVENNTILLAKGLNIIIANTNKTQLDFAKECIHICKSNFIDDSLYLNLPSSFTNNGLDDLLDRITRVLRN
jgi:predicted DNA-binding protein